MTSREMILGRLKEICTEQRPTAIDTKVVAATNPDKLKTFTSILTSIGGEVHEIFELREVTEFVKRTYPNSAAIFSSRDSYDETTLERRSMHALDVVILEGQIGVAENGAIWIDDTSMPDRLLPFITENLILVIRGSQLVSNLHEAYSKIGSSRYEFGTFIAGPSKTADIEQSLVLGAHGPRIMTVFVLNDKI